MRLNNNEDSVFKTCLVPLNDFKSLNNFIAAICHSLDLTQNRSCRIYSLTGLRLNDEDLDFVQDGDFLYLEL